MGDLSYFLVKNFINNTTFFEWDPATYNAYFKKIKGAQEITVPKLNEMACEQVELASVPFVSFVANKGMDGQAANYSFVLRGYVRHWLGNVWAELRPREAQRHRCPGRAAQEPGAGRNGPAKFRRSATTDMERRTPIFIIASPRPRVGKTLLARTLAEFFRSEDRPVSAFDCNPGEFALVDYLPGYTAVARH